MDRNMRVIIERNFIENRAQKRIPNSKSQNEHGPLALYDPLCVCDSNLRPNKTHHGLVF